MENVYSKMKEPSMLFHTTYDGEGGSSEHLPVGWSKAEQDASPQVWIRIRPGNSNHSFWTQKVFEPQIAGGWQIILEKKLCNFLLFLHTQQSISATNKDKDIPEQPSLHYILITPKKNKSQKEDGEGMDVKNTPLIGNGIIWAAHQAEKPESFKQGCLFSRWKRLPLSGTSTVKC